MKKVELKDVKSYDPPKHFDMKAFRLQGKEETGIEKFWMGMSHFLPGGGAEYDYEQSPLEKVYFVLEGEITVKTKEGSTVLKRWDSLYLAPNEGREVMNETNEPATMLVVVNYPESQFPTGG